MDGMDKTFVLIVATLTVGVLVIAAMAFFDANQSRDASIECAKIGASWSPQGRCEGARR